MLGRIRRKGCDRRWLFLFILRFFICPAAVIADAGNFHYACGFIYGYWGYDNKLVAACGAVHCGLLSPYISFIFTSSSSCDIGSSSYLSYLMFFVVLGGILDASGPTSDMNGNNSVL